MIEKKEGATIICHKCGTTLYCRMSNYKYPYSNKLQWQNQDGTTHYKYDGGKFTCSGMDKKSKDLKRALKEQDELINEAELSKGI